MYSSSLNNQGKAIVYLRVSTEDQGISGLGLQAQQDFCERVAKGLGIEVVGSYTDILSGKTDPLSRPGFCAAIAAAQSQKAVLMVAKLDRLSRDVYQVARYCNGFMIKNQPRLLISENPSAGEFEINLRASLAQEERRLISERTRAALAVKRAQGCNLGEVGRQAATDKARKTTEEAIAIARELRAQGVSLQKIADSLNDQGYTTSRGSKWTKQALASRLK
jgi:DNA invertase Pin-like site-specific DNA recombinase